MRYGRRLRLKIRSEFGRPDRRAKPKAGGRKNKQGQSQRELEFIARWAALGGQQLKPQHQFHPSRRWKFDWCHVESRVAIEVHGGTWMNKSRHVSGSGFWGDRIKMNAAVRLGWVTFELTTDDLDNDDAYREIIAEISERISERADRGGRDDGREPFGGVYPDRKRRAPKP